jgi:hypothetical protein
MHVRLDKFSNRNIYVPVVNKPVPTYSVLNYCTESLFYSPKMIDDPDVIAFRSKIIQLRHRLIDELRHWQRSRLNS